MYNSRNFYGDQVKKHFSKAGISFHFGVWGKWTLCVHTVCLLKPESIASFQLKLAELQMSHR